MSKSIRVLIVDDSALIRQMLKEIFDATPDIEVVGVAHDPFIARDKIKQLNPDVLTLDVEMPKMDGLQFLGNIMRLRPMPVVMVSTLTAAGAPETLAALEVGAVDYIAKPQARNAEEFAQFAQVLVEKIRVAAVARVQPKDVRRELPPRVLTSISSNSAVYKRIVAIGSSTGGTEAINTLIEGLPGHCPAIVITQHIPAVFSASLCLRLNNRYPMEVLEASEGLEVKPGRIIIAQGGRHLRFRKQGERLFCVMDDGPNVNLHKPSVEVMFDSLRELIGGRKLVVAMLTGMGADGAAAMKRLHDDAAITVAQDEASCVVWGMPKVAVELGAVDTILPLSKIADHLLNKAVKA
ncbi:protein-glutamate methylesterase/protein-glutamine glutaminase [Thalassolituus oleivorans]|uniref:Protein-glutamate methylesterase/protein-glutamine glutaminase n=1 Tax=Thalassolituus oleivorans MIL-1 TaxID=1298593 RepID=M5DTQ1_9GAMM|nr:chemotaxis response regulator protein-glutamate methylesterase [Thalassolituus oleivorans]CCU72904.1 two-component system, chemotaxis family, response regulator CheB [Thalassolituus oleivorans MIL-1]